MSYYPQQPQNPSYGAQNLQFFPSSYGNPVSGHSTPAQAQYGASSSAYSNYGGATGFMSSQQGFGDTMGVSGRMGDQDITRGWLLAFSAEGFDGELPLLEEVGVNWGHIKTKTLIVLNPFARIDQHIMDDSDLFGPIIFCLLFGTFLLLAGKVQFGYIYGLALIGSSSLHAIFKLMSNPELDSASTNPLHGGYGDPNMGMGAMGGMGSSGHGNEPIATLSFARSCSVLGYCLLPLVLTSFVGVAIPMDTLMGYIFTSAAVAWCTYSSSGMFCAVGRMKSMRPLVAYPLMLFYVGFGIMGIFSSRGSGQLAARAGI